MFATLSKYGFEGPFIAALHALYSCPSSQVQLASYLSSSFSLSNGTRQGCPLSPLLFILCLEPLAADIRIHPDIRGVLLRQTEYKLSLFADDVLLTLTRSHISLPNLIALLKDFSSISGYKINTSKTEALPLHIPPSDLITLEQNYSFHWCPDSLEHNLLVLNFISS